MVREGPRRISILYLMQRGVQPLRISRRLRSSMPSLHLPLKGRSVIIRALCVPICKSGMLRRIHPWWFRWRQRAPPPSGLSQAQGTGLKGRSYLSNLISFYDWVISLVDEGRAIYWCNLPRLQQSLFHGLPQYSPGETGCPWPGQV